MFTVPGQTFLMDAAIIIIKPSVRVVFCQYIFEKFIIQA
jgi:hypothetical protein